MASRKLKLSVFPASAPWHSSLITLSSLEHRGLDITSIVLSDVDGYNRLDIFLYRDTSAETRSPGFVHVNRRLWRRMWEVPRTILLSPPPRRCRARGRTPSVEEYRMPCCSSSCISANLISTCLFHSPGVGASCRLLALVQGRPKLRANTPMRSIYDQLSCYPHHICPYSFGISRCH